MLFAKKSLGQHFLKDARILEKIVSASDVTASDTVLEIGPGEGALTRALLSTGCRVIAVELDDRAIEPLSDTFRTEIAAGKLVIFHADIADGLTGDMRHALGNHYKLVANIPYYITGLIIRQFLEIDTQPTLMTLLIQKEVAERIVARDGKESLLSLSVKAYGNPKIICKVGKGAFVPPPSVDSSVIVISDISRQRFAADGAVVTTDREQAFFRAIKTAFAQKRKTIGSTLSAMPKVLAVADKLGISYKTRPEDIDVATWIRLSIG